MIQIDDFLLSDDIFTKYFACDVNLCHGACCVEGDSGAPLEDGEEEKLEKAFDAYSEFLDQKSIEAIRSQGFSVRDCDGDLVTPLVDNRQCAYSIVDGNVTMCAIEKAYMQGKTKFRKPVSCHLYPIRVKKIGHVITALNLHDWDVCKAAQENGRRKGIKVYQALKEPIERVYGRDFYDKILSAASLLDKQK